MSMDDKQRILLPHWNETWTWMMQRKKTKYARALEHQQTPSMEWNTVQNISLFSNPIIWLIIIIMYMFWFMLFLGAHFFMWNNIIHEL